jgi:hypothetical protein
MPTDHPFSPKEPALEFLAILGLKPPVSVEDVKQAYLDKAKNAHPDRGGDARDFMRLHEAFEQATEYARFKAGRMQWLSGWVEQYAEQQELVDEIKTLGGEADVESVESLGQTIGSDFATVMDRLVGVRLSGPHIDDAMIIPFAAKLRRQSGVHRLELIDTSVTAVGLRELHRCDSLRHLDLSGTKVGLQVVESLLGALDRLETLGIHDSGIGWAARMKLRLAHRDMEISG